MRCCPCPLPISLERAICEVKHAMPPKISKTPKTPTTVRKRKESPCADPSNAESSNLCKRIERAMRIIGIPQSEARTRYARLFSCVRAMQGSAKRWQASWALYSIIKDYMHCPSTEPSSDEFRRAIVQLEDELVNLCYVNINHEE